MRQDRFGNYGIYPPYVSHDGEVGWTVQRISADSDVDDGGEIIGEFAEQHDAELFAEAKFESDDALLMDKLRDKYDEEE